MKHTIKLLTALLLVATSMTFAAETRLTDPRLTLMKWTVDGVPREAGVYIPKSDTTNTFPLVFVFHGRNSSINSTIKYFAFHDQWPDAVIVYMQGLPMSISGGKMKGDTGWQLNYGEKGDRDLKFLDAVLETLREKSSIDNNRIYVTGHSLGASFIYLLWQTRGDIFAAVAPVATGLQNALTSSKPPDLMTPKPMLHIAGRKDSIIRFKIQEATVNMVKQINGCDVKPVKWGNNMCAKYPSSTDTPVVTYFHPGGHEMPKDAVSLIIKFFKENQKP
ncbi:MAG: prolyl oligopeptidase family serine peptidase [Kiritimatiellae bacterium]|nr:prolyl oligopeptidase family serine peptidase [Kiritimatiellia bacterium]MDD5519214.1 prolyl oligopeptidase family serine peptidase [Kiritimatiellia bacterium]